MKKKILLTFFVGAIIFFAVSVAKIKAGTETGMGWLWGSTDDGGSPANNTGIGWISMNNTNPSLSGSVSYGVNIPDASCVGAGCNLSGYAWSENIGWVSFQEASGCPAGTCSARREGNVLKGWARIMAMPQAEALIPGNAGGWQGWISLNSANCDTDSNGYIDVACGGMNNTSTPVVTYGADVTKMDGTGTNHTYAWSNELGWIDLSRATINLPLTAPTVTLSASVVVLAEGQSLPKNTTLTWTVTGTATTCTASGGWSGAKLVTGGSDNTISMPANGTIYTLTCCNGTSCAAPVNATGTAGCYDQRCSGTSCPASPGNFVISSSNTTGDGCEQLCTSSASCNSDKNWKEVAP